MQCGGRGVRRVHVNTHTGQKNMMHALYRHTTQDQTVSVGGGLQYVRDGTLT